MQPSDGHLDVGNRFVSPTDHAADAEIFVLARMTVLWCSLDNCWKECWRGPVPKSGWRAGGCSSAAGKSQKSLDGVTQDAIITAAC